MTARTGSSALFRAYLVCSDEGCDAELEMVGTLEEIEALVCDCGLGLQVIGWPVPADS
jgi:hypothetical protein